MKQPSPLSSFYVGLFNLSTFSFKCFISISILQNTKLIQYISKEAAYSDLTLIPESCVRSKLYNSLIIITKDKAIYFPPLHIIQSSLDPPLHTLRRLSFQLICGLFLNSCYSGESLCAWNIKRSPCSYPLLLFPSLTVGNCSHHRLTSMQRTVHTSVKCQSKNSRFFLLALLLSFFCSSLHTEIDNLSILFHLPFITFLIFLFISLLNLVF